jgi:surfactin synthase thioesterase subunit
MYRYEEAAMTESAAEGDAWIRCFHPAPDRSVRLVCFPHAGGSASFYFPVSAALHPEVEVLAVQYPGRQDRRTEEPIDDIPRLADRVFAALQPRLGDRPAFFGHSMGAIVAFEVARRMAREDGSAPARLVLSGRRAPSRRRDERMHLRDENGIIAELKSLSGTASGLLDDEEMRRMILPAIRSDYRAIETYAYTPGPPLSCPITVFTGDQDPQVTLDEARAWHEHTTGGFDLDVFGGGHFYLTARPAEVIARLSAVLRADG